MFFCVVRVLCTAMNMIYAIFYVTQVFDKFGPPWVGSVGSTHGQRGGKSLPPPLTNPTKRPKIGPTRHRSDRVGSFFGSFLSKIFEKKHKGGRRQIFENFRDPTQHQTPLSVCLSTYSRFGWSGRFSPFRRFARFGRFAFEIEMDF
jgi:hypothetical protein